MKMQVHRNLSTLPRFEKAVVTVGTFDGVHRGHQKLIARILQLSREIGGESVLITFDPHPRTVVSHDGSNVRLLTTLDERVELLDVAGVEHLVVVPFTKEFSLLTARDYVEKFLVEKFNPAVIVIGYNHRFGHHRDGNIELLRHLSATLGFRVEEISKQMVEEIEVSSTRIRLALEEGDVTTAAHLLSHPYSIRGKVVKGNQLGRKFGFPTANMEVADAAKQIPADGVYAVRVKVPGTGDGVWTNGAVSIGFRPTVNGTHHTIEAYIFDFDGDLYDREIAVQFIAYLREEIKFETVDLMIEEIKRDELRARKILDEVK